MPQALFLLLLLCLPVVAQNGKVVGISDGDTITILSDRKQTKVRLAGIDAPEKGQDYSDAAKRFLSSLIFGETVTLEGSKVDRYRRTVAKVIHNGRDINYLMIQNGYAWHFSKYAGEQSAADRVAYFKAEVGARMAKLNLWRYPNPVPPWDFRDGNPVSASPQRLMTATVPVTTGGIIGNKNSMIYHYPGCPSYDKVAEKNRVFFTTRQEAERAGYRVAKNC